jgi:PBSX family phage portal protein
MTEQLAADAVKESRAEAFTFGEPMPVLSQRELFDYLEAMNNGKWYEPPLSLRGLARVYQAAVHHASAIQVKRNILRACFIPHRLLGVADFTAWALDFLIFGNGYLQQQQNRLRGVMALKHLPAKYTRVGVDLDRYWWVPNHRDEQTISAELVHHLKECDINQEIYGLPDYVASMNSSLLNESATLFRRRYYENGSHAGFIMYLTNAAQKEDDITAIRQALKDSKGPGNFRNLFLYAPGGDKDGLKLIPVAEVAAKDEFLSIKNVTRDDQMAGHRVPPQLMCIIPNNTGGFGDANKAAQVFDATELESLRVLMQSVNDWIGEEVVRFKPYALAVESVTK